MASRVLQSSLTNLKGWVASSKNRMTKIVRGNGTPGERAAPTKSGTNDSKIGSRLDVGALVTKNGKQYRRYYLQLNLDAENSTIRKMARKDSHRNWSFADVEIKENPTEEETAAALDSLFDDLSNNAEKD
ncbi:hypothetical protein FQN50_006901 [Emmonsiellopsis sp. PD_5]|nr:hypothetical protein FQN50_006901 [Emmonsiellopsis sp. PD_5]